MPLTEPFTNKILQVFILNIPSDYCLNEYNPALQVTCKVERIDGKQGLLEFLGVDTLLMCFVKDWMGVHKLAIERADVLWNRTPAFSTAPMEDKSVTLENAVSEDHDLAVMNLIS